MRLSILILSLSFVALPGFAAAPATANGVDQPRAFVQAFYDWYVKDGANSDAALEKRPAYFSPQLIQALKADAAAAAKSPDEVVGLDFDPFLNSQDVCAPYRVITLKRSGDQAEVGVIGSCADSKPGQPDVIAQLILHGDSWAFMDFVYPARDGQPQEDLFSILTKLQQERDKTPK
jgi:hypothetical protein